MSSASDISRRIQTPDSNTVSLWWTDLDWAKDAVDAALCQLSSDECERADKFVRPVDRNRFIAARAFLRRVLAERVNTSPREIRFEYERNGKPRLGGDVKVCFNIAHSGNRAVIAVSNGCEIGVDVEQIRLRNDCLDIARRFFATEEQRALLSFDEEDRVGAFYRCWTRKEACVKAVGGGLSIPLNSFAVSIAVEEFPAVLRASSDITSSCTLIDISPDSNFAAALAVFGDTVSVPESRQFQWPDYV